MILCLVNGYQGFHANCNSFHEIPTRFPQFPCLVRYRRTFHVNLKFARGPNPYPYPPVEKGKTHPAPLSNVGGWAGRWNQQTTLDRGGGWRDAYFLFPRGWRIRHFTIDSKEIRFKKNINSSSQTWSNHVWKHTPFLNIAILATMCGSHGNYKTKVWKPL